MPNEKSDKPEETSTPPKSRSVPTIDFSTFVLSLASTALIHLGVSPEPDSGKPLEPAPELARETIDLLGMLREKTRGNLTEEEDRLLERLLYDLRMQFVATTKKKS